MPSTNTQDTRVCRLSTPLPANTLTLVEFSGAEHINDITVYTVRAVADDVVTMADLLGEAMQIDIVHADQSERVVHLICYSARYLGRAESGHLYEFELRPWFWMMSYKVNSRIFHEMTVIEILTKMFRENGGAAGSSFADKTTGMNRKLEYVVQYRESDLAFCRRLMEEVGINFHVEMADNSHKLVMTSDGASFSMLECAAVRYHPSNTANLTTEIPLSSWQPQAQVASFGLRMVDYNYLTPSADMEAKDERPGPTSVPQHVVYDHPGRYDNRSDGASIARRRLAALRTHDDLVMVDASNGVFGAGMVFNLEEHEVDDGQCGNYIVLSATTHFSGIAYRSGAGGSGAFHSSYVVTKEGNPVAPLQVTPRPRVVGPQTAVVVQGAETGEKHGRIKVRFHWESNDDSMLVRVAQTWASKNWGAVFVPHVGMEVVVEFLDGDPDRPLVTGCVYNAENTMPWDGEAEKHVSGIKTVNNNSLSFHDADDEEKICIHAQRDMETTVENNETVTVIKDAARAVDGKQVVEIQGTSDHIVQGAITIESQASITLKVGGSRVEITPSAVKISAAQIEISATASLKTTGLMAEHGASGVLKIQAPLVNIN